METLQHPLKSLISKLLHSEYLTYKEWKQLKKRKVLLALIFREYLTYKEWKHHLSCLV